MYPKEGTKKKGENNLGNIANFLVKAAAFSPPGSLVCWLSVSFT